MRNKFSIKLRLINIIVIMCLYLLIEVFFKALSGSLDGINGWTYWSLIGQTSLWQCINAGVLGFVIGQTNEYPKFYNINLKIRCIGLGLLATIMELITGILFNLHFHMNLWNYNLPFSFMHQINLFFSIGWCLLVIVGIFMDDLCTKIIFDEGEIPNLWEMYRDLFKLQ